VPELPEVETMRRCVLPIVGSRIRDVRRLGRGLCPIEILPGLRSLRARVRGRTITAVERAGKRVVIVLDGGDRIVVEPRMTGLVLLAAPPDNAHLRLVLELEGGAAQQVLFWDQRGLGIVRLVGTDGFQALYGPTRLGPDAAEIDAGTLRQRLGGSRRPIKVALLDQRALAGVGNLYASEILHRARIHPALPCCRLRAAQWRRLQAELRTVLQDAIALEGSTLADGTYRVGQGQNGGFQDYHRVYQRTGKACVQCCRGRVIRIVQAQRSTFFCPRCQRLPRDLRGPATRE